MPRHPDSREVQMERWVQTRICYHPQRYAWLMEAVPGDERWIDDVQQREYPHWAKRGQAKRRFRHAAKTFAIAIWDQTLPPVDDSDDGGTESDERVAPLEGPPGLLSGTSPRG